MKKWIREAMSQGKVVGPTNAVSVTNLRTGETRQGYFAVGGECPVCGSFGIFTHGTGRHCEGCNTWFDAEMNVSNQEDVLRTIEGNPYGIPESNDNS